MECPEKDLCEFLETHVAIMRQMRRKTKWLYPGIHGLVLKRGTMYQVARKPKEYGWGEWKYCFANAYRLADRNPELTYVEGFALGVLMVPHAWVVTPDGAVIDNTWRDRGKSAVPLKERAYIGLPLKLDYVRSIIDKTGTYGALDAWELDWPLLTGEHQLDDILEVRHGEEAAASDSARI